MWHNYLKISFRNFRKFKGYTFINIADLAIGIACCLLIMLFVLDELSYDRHFKNADQVYRVAVRGLVGNQEKQRVFNKKDPRSLLIGDR